VVRVGAQNVTLVESGQHRQPSLGAKSEVIVIDASGRDIEKAQQSDSSLPAVEPRTSGLSTPLWSTRPQPAMTRRKLA
jgi:hypothetical protein